MGASKKPFGLLIREARTELGMTQKQLAEALGVTQATVSRMERDGTAGKEREVPHKMKEAFCRLLDENGLQLQGLIAPECPGPPLPAPPGPASGIAGILAKEILAARKALGEPAEAEGAEALSSTMSADELMEAAGLLKAALELRSNRELLAAAQASRRRWEAKAGGR